MLNRCVQDPGVIGCQFNDDLVLQDKNCLSKLLLFFLPVEKTCLVNIGDQLAIQFTDMGKRLTYIDIIHESCAWDVFETIYIESLALEIMMLKDIWSLVTKFSAVDFWQTHIEIWQ